MLEIGTKAPNFTLPNKDGEDISLSNFKGKKVILYFYPKDNTKGCTLQALGFKEYFEKFKGKGYRLYEAVEDEDYIKAQRYAIETFDRTKKTISFYEYIELLDILEERPVKDEEFIDCYLADKESSLIRSVYGFASSAENYLLTQFQGAIDDKKWVLICR